VFRSKRCCNLELSFGGLTHFHFFLLKELRGRAKQGKAGQGRAGQVYLHLLVLSS